LDWNLTKEVVEAIVKHQSKKIALSIAVVSLILLILFLFPLDFLQRVKIYRAWVFIIFLIAVFYLPAGAVLHKIEMAYAKHGWYQRLHRLTPEEKCILNLFVEPHMRSQIISRANAVARGLVDDGILYAPNVPGTVREISYNIQDWAMTYLRGHRELLQTGAASK